MNKSINLKSLSEILKTKNDELINSFKIVSDSGYGIHSKNELTHTELKDLNSLTQKIIGQMNPKQLDGYFLSYTIEEGMREEFDVLRFSENSVLNIELKSEMPSDEEVGIKRQLVNHRHILQLLDMDIDSIHLFTYVRNKERTYQLIKDGDEDKLIIIEACEIVQYIDDDFKLENQLLHTDMQEMIISPYTEPKKFRTHTYFLNDDQYQTKHKILDDKSNIITITGGPGTGKSLLLMDLAQEYHNKGKNVLVFVGAVLNNQTEINKHFAFDILGTVDMDELEKQNYDHLDIILVDEAQRLYDDTRNLLLDKSENTKIIFSIDQDQAIHDKEIIRNNTAEILAISKNKPYELNDSVRSNKSISTFIYKFLKLNAKKLQPMEFPDVEIVYFESENAVFNYLESITQEKDFVSIELSEFKSFFNNLLSRKHIYYGSLPVNNIIGQDYDNVVVTIDKHFNYNQHAELASDYEEAYPYNENRAIFQALTRVRKKLKVVVYDNPEIYIKLQKILTWAKDTMQNNDEYDYFNYGFHTNKNTLEKILNLLNKENINDLESFLEDNPEYEINIPLKDLVNHLNKANE